MAKHRAAVRFDTIERFGLRLSEVRALPCSDAWACLSGLAEDSRTHLYAAIAGQTFQGSHADLASVITAQLLISMTREKGAKPIIVPGPFTGAQERAKAKQRAQVAPAERKRLEEQLRRYSSIPD